MARRYGAGNDGCWWCPDEDRSARSDDTHYNKHQATVILGANGKWRLCEACSRLPRFARLRKRVPIEPRDCPAPSRQPHGRHEWYTGGAPHPGTPDDRYCRACGKLEERRS